MTLLSVEVLLGVGPTFFYNDNHILGIGLSSLLSAILLST